MDVFNILRFYLPLSPSIIYVKVKKTLLLLEMIIAGQILLAQVPEYKITFNQIFDNREYFSEYAFPQTIFGARLDAALLFHVDSTSHFAAGMSYFYENGSSVLENSPNVILYYEYSGDKLALNFGSFPRREKLEMPDVFLNDTLNYYRPNVEGALLSYTGSIGKVQGFIDWTGRVSEDRRETFLAGFTSEIFAGKIFIEPSFLMYHNARSYASSDTIHLQDNGIMSILAGYSVNETGKSISLKLSSGFISSYNRFRPDEFSWGKGIISNIKLGYGIFGLKGVYYFGTPIEFEYGDPFYRSGNYGRLDLFADPFRNPRIQSKIGWNLHFVPGEGIHHSQQVLIQVVF